jgi:hypothetical protein
MDPRDGNHDTGPPCVGTRRFPVDIRGNNGLSSPPLVRDAKDSAPDANLSAPHRRVVAWNIEPLGHAG